MSKKQSNIYSKLSTINVWTTCISSLITIIASVAGISFGISLALKKHNTNLTPNKAKIVTASCIIKKIHSQATYDCYLQIEHTIGDKKYTGLLIMDNQNIPLKQEDVIDIMYDSTNPSAVEVNHHISNKTYGITIICVSIFVLFGALLNCWLSRRCQRK